MTFLRVTVAINTTLNAPKFRMHSHTVQSKTTQALRQVSTLPHRESDGIDISSFLYRSMPILWSRHTPTGYWYFIISQAAAQLADHPVFPQSICGVCPTNASLFCSICGVCPINASLFCAGRHSSPPPRSKAKFLLHFQPFAATIEEIKYMEEWTHGKY